VTLKKEQDTRSQQWSPRATCTVECVWYGCSKRKKRYSERVERRQSIEANETIGTSRVFHGVNGIAHEDIDGIDHGGPCDRWHSPSIAGRGSMDKSSAFGRTVDETRLQRVIRTTRHDKELR
jgi:hypothetical protein